MKTLERNSCVNHPINISNVTPIFYVKSNKIFLALLGKFRDGVVVPRAAKLFLDGILVVPGNNQNRCPTFRRNRKTRARSTRKCSKVPTYISQSTDCRQRLSRRVSALRPALCDNQSNLFRALSSLSIEFRQSFVKKNCELDAGNL